MSAVEVFAILGLIFGTLGILGSILGLIFSRGGDS